MKHADEMLIEDLFKKRYQLLIWLFEDPLTSADETLFAMTVGQTDHKVSEICSSSADLFFSDLESVEMSGFLQFVHLDYYI